MNKSKAPIIVIIAAVVFLAGLMLFMNGINIGISGVFSFTTKYYETPQEAYEHFESQPLKISEKVDFIQIDDHNGMFIGAGEDNGEESYVFVSMQTKDKKYFCSGFCSVVDYSTDSESSSLGGKTNWSNWMTTTKHSTSHQGMTKDFILRLKSYRD